MTNIPAWSAQELARIALVRTIVRDFHVGAVHRFHGTGEFRRLGMSQARVSDLVRGKWDKCSLDMLSVLASRAGLKPGLTLAKAA